MQNQRNIDEQYWKEQMDAIRDVLDVKVSDQPFEDLKHRTVSTIAHLTPGHIAVNKPVADDTEGKEAHTNNLPELGQGLERVKPVLKLLSD